MASNEDKNQDAHNQGQRDGANNDYHNPGSPGIFNGWSESSRESLSETREAYDNGYENGKNSR